MHKAIEIIRRAEQKTTAWSGGTTTEVAIFPRDAQYSRRDFDWRLSSATVETDHSVFTSLPGIHRILMVTDGHLDLQHEGHHEISLDPFQYDAFNGSWTTHSRGRARDFNVMMSDPCQATMKVLLSDATIPEYRETLMPLEMERHQGWEMVYGVKGSLVLSRGEEWEATLRSGDLLVVDRALLPSPLEFFVTAEGDAYVATRISIVSRDS